MFLTGNTEAAVGASNWPFVQGVLSGDGVPADIGFQWRFIDATWFQAASYIGIMTLETITGIVLLIAGITWLRASATSDRWNHAQKLTFIGGFLSLTIFFFGFMVVGGNWFIMYLNSKFGHDNHHADTDDWGNDRWSPHEGHRKERYKVKRGDASVLAIRAWFKTNKFSSTN